MMQSQFSLAWDSYKSNVCNGLSALQQNGEFVDMTLAADGHYVKVHQILVALASPYLKDLITSAPCQHPVIYLNNVSHRVLCLLLEYIYSGEVVVPSDCLSSFAETAKSLHIRGLENIGSATSLPIKLNTSGSHLEDLCQIASDKNIGSQDINTISEEVCLPPKASNIFLKHGPSMRNRVTSNASATKDDSHDFPDLDDDITHNDSDDGFKMDVSSIKNISSEAVKPTSKLQFTVSIRGSLQAILNRYIYNLHSTTRTGFRRWRCVDYRNNKCSAYVTTKGNVVVSRGNLHNHAFHDKKILSKIEKKAIYSAIEEVEVTKDNEKEGHDKNSEDNDVSMENDFFMPDEESFGDNVAKSSTVISDKES